MQRAADSVQSECVLPAGHPQYILNIFFSSEGVRGFGNDFKTAPQSTFDNSVCKEGMICAFPLEKRTGRKSS